MTHWSHSLYGWLALAGLLIGHMGVAAKLLPRLRGLTPLSRWLAHAFTAAVLTAWIARILVAGHLPLFGTYESALSLALATMIAALIWEHRGRRGIVLTPLAALTAGALMAHGRGFDPTPYALTISEASWVVDVHAVVAWAAFGVLAVNGIFALMLLFRKDGNRAVLGRWLVTSLQIGFLLHTGMLVSGSIYKFMLFGTPWSFDPVETLGLVTWLAYGTLLHLNLFAEWHGARLARWCLAIFVILVVSYRGIVYFPAWSTYHIFDMDLRLHVVTGKPEGRE